MAGEFTARVFPMPEFLIRPVFPADHAAISDLLRAGYARHMRSAYPEALVRQTLPILTHIAPALLFGGRYYLAEAEDEVLAIAGWSDISPFGRTCPPGQAHLRHLATAPDWQGRGLGRALLAHLMAAAGRSGVHRLHCLCPMNAASFCESGGFESLGEVVLGLSLEVNLPAVHMRRDLAQEIATRPEALEAGATL